MVAAFLTAIDVTDDQTRAAAVSGAGVGGLSLGRILVRNRTFAKDQANLVGLGTTAGSLFGVGVAAALELDGDAFTVLQALGSTVGLGVTYSLFANDARRASSGLSSVHVDVAMGPSLARVPGRPGGGRSLSEGVVPKVALTMSF